MAANAIASLRRASLFLDASPRRFESGAVDVATKSSDRNQASGQPDRATPVVVMPKQTADQIAQRRLIRETFHDSKAKTIVAPPRRRRH